MQYINTGELSHDINKAHKVQIQSARFSLVNEQLFKRSLDEPYLKCLTTEQGHYVLAELHERICGNHLGGRTLGHIAHTQGYYWPTLRVDASNYVRTAQELISITSPWPFAQWGIYIVGTLPTTLAQKKLLLVATDYFSKWIEVEAFASIKDQDVTQFIWKNIVYQFGIPLSIVSDNGPQFDSRAYRNFCYELKIKNLYSTP